jgi:hypothetical protein
MTNNEALEAKLQAIYESPWYQWGLAERRRIEAEIGEWCGTDFYTPEELAILCARS